MPHKPDNIFNIKENIKNILLKIYENNNYDIQYKNISFYIWDHFYKWKYFLIIDNSVIWNNKDYLKELQKEKTKLKKEQEKYSYESTNYDKLELLIDEINKKIDNVKDKKYIEMNYDNLDNLMSELSKLYNYDIFKLYWDIFLNNNWLLNIDNLCLEYILDRNTVLKFEENVLNKSSLLIDKEYWDIIDMLKIESEEMLSYLKLTNKNLIGYELKNNNKWILLWFKDGSMYTTTLIDFFVEYQLNNY